MSEPYSNAAGAYTREYGEDPPENMMILFEDLRRIIDQAYQGGYEACIRANLFKEDIHNEHEKHSS